MDIRVLDGVAAGPCSNGPRRVLGWVTVVTLRQAGSPSQQTWQSAPHTPTTYWNGNAQDSRVDAGLVQAWKKQKRRPIFTASSTVAMKTSAECFAGEGYAPRR